MAASSAWRHPRVRQPWRHSVGRHSQNWGEDRVGGVILLPFEGLAYMQTFYDDEREQYFSNRLSFARLGQNSRREGIGFGISYGFRPWLSMGVSLLLQPETKTVNQIFTPNAAQPDVVHLNIQTENGLSEALVLGIQVDPDWPIRLGVVVQDELGFAMSARNRIQVRGTNEEEGIVQSFDTMNGYHPPRAAIGLGVTISEDLELIGEATWLGWSRFVDLHSENAGFEDVWEGRTAFEWGSDEGSRFRLGLGWRPTPVGPQTGRTNFIANDRWSIATGGGGTFKVRDETLELNLSVQLQGLVEHTVYKRENPGGTYPVCAGGEMALCDEFPDPGPGATEETRRQSEGLQTGNPGFPGYRHGGYIIHAGVQLSWVL